MKINDAKKILKNIIEKKVHIPVLLVGQTGVGKTWLVREVAQTLNIEYIDLRLAQMEIGDLIGLPITIHKNEHNVVTHWAKPSWWPEENTRGILCFEELNRAQQDVRQAVFQIINERVLHTHKLPEEWHIVAVINPPDGFYQVDEIDKAMLRRFCILNVTPSVQEWIDWANNANISHDIITFIKKNPQMLLINTKGSLLRNQIPTPDGYRMLSLLLKENVIPPLPYLKQEVIAGIIGKEAATAFLSFLRSNKTENVDFTTGEEIVLNYIEKKEDIIKKTPIELLEAIDEALSILEHENLNSKTIRTNINQFLLDISNYNYEIFIHFCNLLANNTNEEIQKFFSKLPARKELTKLIKNKRSPLEQLNLWQKKQEGKK
uniref:AAA family ATPase n=1 Tax=Desulfurella acetivorans TaxID=33002 RepID=A0A832AV23_DESAE